MADHVQLPQFWMKAFKNNRSDGGTYQTYCFNLTEDIKTDGNNVIASNSIGSIQIDSVGVEDNHYHKKLEKYLSNNWEIKFGNIKTSLAKQIRSGLKNIIITEEDEIFLKKFIAISISRSRTFKKEIERREGKFFALNDIAVLSVMSNELKLFENFEIQFLHNTSNTNFVLPSYTIYYVQLRKCTIPIVVLTPKIAIRFISKDKCRKICKGVVLNISDEEHIKHYNQYALLCEGYTNKDFIISKTKKELEYLYNGE